MTYKTFAMFLSLSLLCGCQSVSVYDPDDPYESINRPVDSFNHQVDVLILNPATGLYNTLVPGFLRHGLHRVFMNFSELSNIVNAGLQGHWPDFENSVERLSINTFCGFLGFFDRAHETGRYRTRHDFGQTLYYWGYEHSDYIVLPFIGPSTFRDAFGLVIDSTLFNPLVYINEESTKNILAYTQIFDSKATFNEKYKDIQVKGYFDKYIINKNGFLQYRQSFLQPVPPVDSYEIDF